MFRAMNSREVEGRKALTQWAFAILFVFVLFGLVSAHFIWTDEPSWALFWLYGLIVLAPTFVFIGYRISQRIFAGIGLDNLERDIVGPLALAVFAYLLLFALSATVYS